MTHLDIRALCPNQTHKSTSCTFRARWGTTNPFCQRSNRSPLPPPHVQSVRPPLEFRTTLLVLEGERRTISRRDYHRSAHFFRLMGASHGLGALLLEQLCCPCVPIAPPSLCTSIFRPDPSFASSFANHLYLPLYPC